MKITGCSKPMRKLILTFFFLISIIIIFPGIGYTAGEQKQADFNDDSLFPVVQERKWGFMDASGQVVIKPQFSAIRPFHDGMAAVYFNGKWGFIDPQGNIAVKIQYDGVLNFHEGLAAVMSGWANFGYIDKTGKYVIPPKFAVGYHGFTDSEDEIIDFRNGIAVVENGDTSQFINPKGQVVAEFYDVGSWSEGLIAAVGSRDGHFGYVNNQGDFVIKPQFDMAFPFYEGLAVVIIDNKYGYIDKTGKIIIKPQFEVDYSELSHGDFYSFRRFSEGVARCVYQGYYSFIDKSGKIVFKTNVPYTVFPSAIGPETDVGDFREGLAWVKQNGLCGYLDKSGQMVIQPQYVVAFPFKNGLAIVGKTVGDTVKYGYIDRTGKSIIELQYESVGEFQNGLAAVWVDYERLGYIDRTGKYIWDPDKSTWPVDPIVVTLNGKQMDFDTPPVLRNGRTLVPVRAIGEALGADVEWDEGIQTVYLTINGNTVALVINDKTALINNQPVDLDEPAGIINGRTMVPLRFISEAFNAKVNWDGQTRSVTITST